LSKLGLLTLPLVENYGGIIQCACLASFLREEGHEVVLLRRAPDRSLPMRLAVQVLEKLPGQNIRGFRQRAHELAQNQAFIDAFVGPASPLLYSSDDMARYARKAQIAGVVVGSDQVWRMQYVPKGGEGDYFLAFADDSMKRVAYAASFGHDTWNYPELTAQASALLQKFDHAAVREKSGAAICRDVFGRDSAVHVLDPTMLVDPAIYDRMSPPAPVAGDQAPYLYRYILDDTAEISTITKLIKAALPAQTQTRSTILTDSSEKPTIEQWIANLRSADFVITDSFHGTVFAIIFRKNFVTLVNNNRGAGRFYSLLTELSLADRILATAEQDRAATLVASPIDFDAVHDRIDRWREISRQFLQQALR
jgi:hypothetical protein